MENKTITLQTVIRLQREFKTRIIKVRNSPLTKSRFCIEILDDFSDHFTPMIYPIHHSADKYFIKGEYKTEIII